MKLQRAARRWWRYNRQTIKPRRQPRHAKHAPAQMRRFDRLVLVTIAAEVAIVGLVHLLPTPLG